MAKKAELPVRIVKNPGGVTRSLKFSDEKIQKALDKKLGDIPAEAKVAFVATAYKAPSGSITTEMAVYVRVKKNLSFGGFVRGDVKRPLQEVGAEVRFVV